MAPTQKAAKQPRRLQKVLQFTQKDDINILWFDKFKKGFIYSYDIPVLSF